MKKKRVAEKFKKIFDNLEESIFIVDKEKFHLKYANNFFYTRFRDIIV